MKYKIFWVAERDGIYQLGHVAMPIRFLKLFLFSIFFQLCDCSIEYDANYFDIEKNFKTMMKLKDKLGIDNYVFLDLANADTLERNRPVYKIIKDSLNNKKTIENYCFFNRKRIELKSDSLAERGIGEIFTVDDSSFIIVWHICGPLYMEFYSNKHKIREIIEEAHAHAAGLISKNKKFLFIAQFESFSSSTDVPTVVRIYDTKEMTMLNEIPKPKAKLQFYFMGIDKNENFLYFIERDGRYKRLNLQKIFSGLAVE